MGIIVMKLLEEKIRSVYGASDSIIIAIYLVVAYTFVKVGNFLIKNLVSESLILRRIISGKNHIEGSWISNVDNHGCAICNIIVNGSSLEIDGEHYDLNGNLIYSWTSKTVLFNYPLMIYLSESVTYGVNCSESIMGVTYVQFSRVGDKIPTRYSGYWTDISRRKPQVTFYAEKIISKKHRNSLNTQQGRLALINEFISQGRRAQ